MAVYLLSCMLVFMQVAAVSVANASIDTTLSRL